MAYFNNKKFPWSNFHGMNLDWIIQTVMEYAEQVATIPEQIDEDFQERIDDGTFGDLINEELLGGVRTNVDTLRINPLYPPSPLVPAIMDGVADDTLQLKAIIEYLKTNGNGGGVIEFPNRTTIITDTLSDDGFNITFKGSGSTETGQGTIIKTQGAIAGIYISGNRSSVQDLVIEGDDGLYNTEAHGLLVESSRAYIKNVTTIKNRGDGIHFRLGNVSMFEHVSCLVNKGNGFYVGDLVGALDDNACTFINIDVRANEKSGLYLDSSASFANSFYNVSSQGNLEYGVYVNCDYNSFFGLYVEANTLKDFYFDTGSDYNEIFGWFSNVADWYTDDSTNNRNQISRIAQTLETINATTGVTIGSKVAGLAGYLDIEDTGTEYAVTLKATGGTQILKITSEGAGQLGIDPDFIPLEASILATFQNNWQDYGGSRRPVGFYKDKEGLVHIEGVASSGDVVVPTVMFNLPAGYRPSTREYFGIATDTGFGQIFIESNGDVYYQGGGNIYFSFGNVTFRTT